MPAHPCTPDALDTPSTTKYAKAAGDGAVSGGALERSEHVHVSGDQAVWRYGLADEHGQLPTISYRLRHDPATGSEPVGERHAMLWPTALLLVRQAKGRTRIVYDLTVRPVGSPAPDPPPRGPERRWERSTSGKAKGPGEALSQRAKRDRKGRHRAAA